MQDLKNSIDKFGVAEPIVLNKDGTIIGGHARFYTLRDNGVKEIPCFVADKLLSEDEIKELNVRLNRNIAGEWDWDALANYFDVGELTEWGFTEDELQFWEDEPEEIIARKYRQRYWRHKDTQFICWYWWKSKIVGRFRYYSS